MPSTYTPIATTTLGSAASSVTFSSISGAYTDLILVSAGTMTTSANLYIQVGAGSLDTGTNYSTTILAGDGSSASSFRRSNDNQARLFDIIDTGTGQINVITSFFNYSNTTTNKTFISRVNTASNGVGAVVNLWRSTSAINIITVSKPSSTIAAGSTFTLYGVKSA